jgi:hypothetical protein
MQQYQWAIRVTMEDLDGNGGVEKSYSEERRCATEAEARARHEAIQDSLARVARKHAKYHRIAGSAVIRRPVGEWETVQG